MTLDEVREELAAVKLGLPHVEFPESSGRFPDGTRFRIEIPSVEGPAVMRAVIDEAERCGIRVHRVSQGSGVMMLSDTELAELAELEREHSIEVCLFLGPRAEWDTGGAPFGGIARGSEALEGCVADAFRAVHHGIRSLLVADIGVLDVLGRLRALGRFPSDLRFKTSVSMGLANPASAALAERLGADSLNLVTDLEVGMLAAVRAATSAPIDVYVEAPDELGGFVRSYLVPDIIRVAAPVHVKPGLRNARSVYPSGGHLLEVACAQAREKVRRAALVSRLVTELAPSLA